MISHRDDVPCKSREHGESRFERQGLNRPCGRAGARLSRDRIAMGACFLRAAAGSQLSGLRHVTVATGAAKE